MKNLKDLDIDNITDLEGEFLIMPEDPNLEAVMYVYDTTFSSHRGFIIHYMYFGVSDNEIKLKNNYDESWYYSNWSEMYFLKDHKYEKEYHQSMIEMIFSLLE